MELVVYQRRKAPDQLRLVPAGEPLFPTSPSYADEWSPIARIAVQSALHRPLAAQEGLYVAEELAQYPYTTTQIRAVDNLFYPSQRGLYFVATPDVIAQLKSLGLLVR